MSGPSRILCAVDFSRPTQAAFEQALSLSRACNAELTVVHAVPASERFNDRARERIDKTVVLRRAADSAGVRMRVSEQHGAPVGVILLHAHLGRFDLIVLGTHGATGVERLRIGSISEQVMQNARGPVLVVPVPEDGRRGFPASFRNIVCPVDFSQGSNAALKHAFGLVKSGGRLTLLHVSTTLDPIGAPRSAGQLTVPEHGRWLQQDAWRRLQEAVPMEARTTSDVRVRVVSGTPAAEIVRIAAEVDADLIVMGVTSRGAIGRKLTGSTAVGVIRSGSHPVLAVPGQMLERSGVDLESNSVTRLAA